METLDWEKANNNMPYNASRAEVQRRHSQVASA